MIKFKMLELNKTNKTKEKFPMFFEKQLNEFLNRFKTRAKDALNTSYYGIVNESMPNTNKKLHCKAVALSLTQDEVNKSQYILELSMLHPTMMTDIKRPLAMGDKHKISEFLNNNISANSLKDHLNQMSEKLKNH